MFLMLRFNVGCEVDNASKSQYCQSIFGVVNTFASISDSFNREMLKGPASRCTSQVIEYMKKKHSC